MRPQFDSTTSTSALERVERLTPLVFSYVRWMAVSIGGMCILMYSNRIGHFPEGLSLGEGLAFYLISAGFGLVYLVYVIATVSSGALLMYWPLKYVMRRSRMSRSSAKLRLVKLSVDLSPMWNTPFAVIGLAGLVMLAGYARRDWSRASVMLLLALVQGLLFATFLAIKRTNEHFATGLIVNQTTTAGRQDTPSWGRAAHWAVVALMVVMPFVAGIERSSLVEVAFRLTQLSKGDATVHIRKPWSKRVSESGLVGSESFLGDAYVRFDGVDVLLRSVGQKVVIEIPGEASATSIKLPIPSDSIIVE